MCHTYIRFQLQFALPGDATCSRPRRSQSMALIFFFFVDKNLHYDDVRHLKLLRNRCCQDIIERCPIYSGAFIEDLLFNNIFYENFSQTDYYYLFFYLLTIPACSRMHRNDI